MMSGACRSAGQRQTWATHHLMFAMTLSVCGPVKAVQLPVSPLQDLQMGELGSREVEGVVWWWVAAEA